MRKHEWNHGLWSLVIGGLLGCACSIGTASAGDWCWWDNGEGGGNQGAHQTRNGRPYDPTPGVRQTWWRGRRWPAQPRPVTERARAVDQFHYAHYWPFPNNCIDRATVNEALSIQVANGWMAETTLYDQHFDKDTNVVNEAGKTHLKWILMQTPPQYRTAFVATGVNQQTSDSRLASVQLAAATICGENMPPIVLRNAQPIGANAAESDLIRRKWLATIPSPRITYTTVVGQAASDGP